MIQTISLNETMTFISIVYQSNVMQGSVVFVAAVVIVVVAVPAVKYTLLNIVLLKSSF